jgi:hypothetical protein
LTAAKGRPEVGPGNTNRALVARKLFVRLFSPCVMIVSRRRSSPPQQKKPQGSQASGFVLSVCVCTNPYGLRSLSAKSNNRSRFQVAIAKTRISSVAPAQKCQQSLLLRLYRT